MPSAIESVAIFLLAAIVIASIIYGVSRIRRVLGPERRRVCRLLTPEQMQNGDFSLCCWLIAWNPSLQAFVCIGRRVDVSISAGRSRSA
jgi:hypothetical protein